MEFYICSTKYESAVVRLLVVGVVVRVVIRGSDQGGGHSSGQGSGQALSGQGSDCLIIILTPMSPRYAPSATGGPLLPSAMPRSRARSSFRRDRGACGPPCFGRARWRLAIRAPGGPRCPDRRRPSAPPCCRRSRQP